MVVNYLNAFITLSRRDITCIRIHIVVVKSWLVTDGLAVLLKLRNAFRQGDIRGSDNSLVNLVGRLLLSAGKNSSD